MLRNDVLKHAKLIGVYDDCLDVTTMMQVIVSVIRARGFQAHTISQFMLDPQVQASMATINNVGVGLFTDEGLSLISLIRDYFHQVVGMPRKYQLPVHFQ